MEKVRERARGIGREDVTGERERKRGRGREGDGEGEEEKEKRERTKDRERERVRGRGRERKGEGTSGPAVFFCKLLLNGASYGSFFERELTPFK